MNGFVAVKRYFMLSVFAMLSFSQASATTIDIDVTIRDFHDTHPDFEAGVITYDPGIVTSTLGADGKPVYAGSAGNPTTHGATAFDQWYRDVAGVNTKTTKTLTLDNTITPDTSVYTFTDSSFFPIDHELFGNDFRSHNYHFTLEMHTAFTYEAGQTFSFVGDDDLWVYIDDTLVIDLGGVHGPMGASVSLDSLGLTVGDTYDLDLFFAERQTSGSNFRIDTSIASLVSVPAPAALWLMLLGLIGIGVRKH